VRHTERRDLRPYFEHLNACAFIGCQDTKRLNRFNKSKEHTPGRSGRPCFLEFLLTATCCQLLGTRYSGARGGRSVVPYTW
jgi:hypothetical protein